MRLPRQRISSEYLETLLEKGPSIFLSLKPLGDETKQQKRTQVPLFWKNVPMQSWFKSFPREWSWTRLQIPNTTPTLTNLFYLFARHYSWWQEENTQILQVHIKMLRLTNPHRTLRGMQRNSWLLRIHLSAIISLRMTTVNSQGSNAITEL